MSDDLFEMDTLIAEARSLGAEGKALGKTHREECQCVIVLIQHQSHVMI
jgi:hypothetical protein